VAIVERNGRKYRLSGNLNKFQIDLQIHLIDWKWEHITREAGMFKTRSGELVALDALLPASIPQDALPLLYPPIRDPFREHQEAFPFATHDFFHHMASSQAANANLFLPILLHPKANGILRRLKPDLHSLATGELYKGFQLEYTGTDPHRGPLGDSSIGTEADLAIAYFNQDGERCLWLIEHKLTEADFTHYGGARSKNHSPIHDCGHSFGEILGHKDYCYYHSHRRSKYWQLTEGFSGTLPQSHRIRYLPVSLWDEPAVEKPSPGHGREGTVWLQTCLLLRGQASAQQSLRRCQWPLENPH
jgi:hypothetical protein